MSPPAPRYAHRPLPTQGVGDAYCPRGSSLAGSPNNDSARNSVSGTWSCVLPFGMHLQPKLTPSAIPTDGVYPPRVGHLCKPPDRDGIGEKPKRSPRLFAIWLLSPGIPPTNAGITIRIDHPSRGKHRMKFSNMLITVLFLCVALLVSLSDWAAASKDSDATVTTHEDHQGSRYA
jgi:hypothetical protein